jgi:hypothetical protein
MPQQTFMEIVDGASIIGQKSVQEIMSSRRCDLLPDEA